MSSNFLNNSAYSFDINARKAFYGTAVFERALNRNVNIHYRHQLHESRDFRVGELASHGRSYHGTIV